MWPIPVLCVLVGMATSFITAALDSGTLISVEFVGGPDAALAILGAIAASMITLTGIVLTIVLVVVQLATDQFSPRIVRAILYDRPSQLAIGIFAAAFAHAMLAMRKIASTEDGAPVPGLSIIVAFALVVVSIVVLILYINHIGQSLRAAALIESVGKETIEVLDQLYPGPPGEPGDGDPDPSPPVLSPVSGVLFRVDYEELVNVARDADCVVTLIPMVGDFVPGGAPLFRVEGERARFDIDEAVAALAIGPERTLNQDVAYGCRMLVDIAVRSLSDAFDPTTAVQAIDRLHDILRQLARRPFPAGEYRDSSGTVRLRVAHMSWEGYVRLAFDEIRQTGADSIQVMRRVRAALDDLLTVAPADRRQPILDQLASLDAMRERDGAVAGIIGDMQGIGSGSDVRYEDGQAPPAARAATGT